MAYRGQAFNQWLHACQDLMLPSRSHSLAAHTLREKRPWQECHLFVKSVGVSGINRRLRKCIGTFEHLQLNSFLLILFSALTLSLSLRSPLGLIHEYPWGSDLNFYL